MANNVFAYPCTRGTSQIGKIMSERMISTLAHALCPVDGVKIEDCVYLLDGYYFVLDPTFESSATDFYFYTESLSETDFPELYVEENDSIFSSQKSLTGYDEHHFVKSTIPSVAQAWQPFYVAEQSDPDQTSKIWIKASTMNPHVYYNGLWQPLGAVYKTTTT